MSQGWHTLVKALVGVPTQMRKVRESDAKDSSSQKNPILARDSVTCTRQQGEGSATCSDEGKGAVYTAQRAVLATLCPRIVEAD